MRVMSGKTQDDGRTSLIRIPTREAYEVIMFGRGRAYEELVLELIRVSKCSRQDVVLGLVQLCGPISFDEWFRADREYIVKQMPNVLVIRGKPFRLIEGNPVVILHSSAVFGEQALENIQKFGGVQGLLKLRQKFVQKGGNPEEWDRQVIRRTFDGYRKFFESVWKRLDKDGLWHSDAGAE
jgi:hypothetical protein